jgi:hypothetical protein
MSYKHPVPKYSDYIIERNNKKRERIVRGFGKTPDGNTGSIDHGRSPSPVLQMAHCDYIVFTGSSENLPEIIDLIWATFGITVDLTTGRPGTKGKYYDCNVTCPLGLALSIAHGTGIIAGTMRLSIPGKALAIPRRKKLFEFFKCIYDFHLRCTRIDWTLDDYERIIPMESFQDWGKSEEFFGASSHTYYYSKKKHSERLAETCYFGSFQSDKVVRIYDKNVESEGKINAIRVEFQFRNSQADFLFSKYMKLSEPLPAAQSVTNWCLSRFGFIDLTSTRKCRCKVKEEWRLFVEKFGEKLAESIPPKTNTIEKKMRWIASQVAPTIAVVSAVLGNDICLHWLLGCVREASSRMSDSSLNLIDFVRHSEFLSDKSLELSLSLC